MKVTNEISCGQQNCKVFFSTMEAFNKSDIPCHFLSYSSELSPRDSWLS